jgi:hypothetical protein
MFGGRGHTSFANFLTAAAFFIMVQRLTMYACMRGGEGVSFKHGIVLSSFRVI